MDGPGLAVVIGTEHSDPDLRACSVVVAPYRTARAAAMSVVGPTRMHYLRAISVVDGAATAVPRYLRDENSPPRGRFRIMTNLPTSDKPTDGPGPLAADEPTPLEAVSRERDDLRDRLLRKTADSTISASGSSASGANFAEWAAANLVNDVLAVINDFERALAVEAPRKRRLTAAASS